jgi:hypothetical protein
MRFGGSTRAFPGQPKASELAFRRFSAVLLSAGVLMRCTISIMSQKQSDQQRASKGKMNNNGLIIEMKRTSIIRKKWRFEEKRSSLKNGGCCKSLAGLCFSSGEVRATSVEKGLSNRLLHRTQTLKGGQGSKVLFRLEPFATDVWVR